MSDFVTVPPAGKQRVSEEKYRFHRTEEVIAAAGGHSVGSGFAGGHLEQHYGRVAQVRRGGWAKIRGVTFISSWVWVCEPKFWWWVELHKRVSESARVGTLAFIALLLSQLIRWLGPLVDGRWWRPSSFACGRRF